MATPELNTGDQKSGEHEWPKLERRRERPPAAAGYGLAEQASMGAADVPAIYLIEREAIRLRRRRWQQPEVASPEDSTVSPGAASAEAPGPAQQPRGGDPLYAYARPPESIQQPTLSQRIGTKVRSLLAYLKGRS